MSDERLNASSLMAIESNSVLGYCLLQIVITCFDMSHWFVKIIESAVNSVNVKMYDTIRLS